MGTRADFYVGRGDKAEWIGSIAWDGYPDGIKPSVLKTTTEKTFRVAVEAFFRDRTDVTLSADGWPWPWDNSRTTDYSYAFDSGQVWASCFGSPWFNPLLPQPEQEDTDEEVSFPDMAQHKNNPPIGSRKSGIMVFHRP